MDRRTRELTDELINRHGLMMDFAEISHEIGMKNKVAVHAFLEGLPVYAVGKRRRWLASDVARRILEGEETQY